MRVAGSAVGSGYADAAAAVHAGGHVHVDRGADSYVPPEVRQT